MTPRYIPAAVALSVLALSVAACSTGAGPTSTYSPPVDTDAKPVPLGTAVALGDMTVTALRPTSGPAVDLSMDAAYWQAMFEQAMARIAGRFKRVEPRATARAFVLGLLSGVERKNCWRLAEQAGHARLRSPWACLSRMC